MVCKVICVTLIYPDLGSVKLAAECWIPAFRVDDNEAFLLKMTLP